MLVQEKCNLQYAFWGSGAQPPTTLLGLLSFSPLQKGVLGLVCKKPSHRMGVSAHGGPGFGSYLEENQKDPPHNFTKNGSSSDGLGEMIMACDIDNY